MSRKPLINYRVSTLVDFLNAFCQKLGIDKPTVVGNSLGGWTAMAYAVAYRSNRQACTRRCCEGLLRAKRMNEPALTRDLLMRLNPGSVTALKELMNGIAANKQMVNDQMATQLSRPSCARTTAIPSTSSSSRFCGAKILPSGKLGSIKAPTIVIWGRQDTLTSRHGSGLREGHPGAQMTVLDGCGRCHRLSAHRRSTRLCSSLSAALRRHRERTSKAL
jgi:pimeloyl-ACP methyl ester carboxylesterase